MKNSNENQTIWLWINEIRSVGNRKWSVTVFGQGRIWFSPGVGSDGADRGARSSTQQHPIQEWRSASATTASAGWRGFPSAYGVHLSAQFGECVSHRWNLLGCCYLGEVALHLLTSCLSFIHQEQQPLERPRQGSPAIHQNQPIE